MWYPGIPFTPSPISAPCMCCCGCLLMHECAHNMPSNLRNDLFPYLLVTFISIHSRLRQILPCCISHPFSCSLIVSLHTYIITSCYISHPFSFSLTASLHIHVMLQALTLGLWVQWPGGPVDLKTYWPPKKLTGPGGPVDLKTYWPPKKLTGPPKN